MKGAKTIWSEENSYWLMDLHWDIFWDLRDMQGYGDKVFCSGCKQYTIYNIKDYHMALRCSKCDKTYSPTANTIFANSKIWLPIWLKAIHIIKVVNPDITLRVLMQHLDCTSVTACSIKRKIKSINESSIEFRLYKKHEQTVIDDFN